MFAPIERGEASSKFLVELGKLSGARLLVFFQKAESLPDDFTGGVVAASLYLAQGCQALSIYDIGVRFRLPSALDIDFYLNL